MRERHSFSRRGFVLALLLATWAAHQSGVLHAQATEGRSFIQVRNADGSPVIDLTAEDFVIEQNGVDCKVIRVELINEPLRLALVVDDAGGAQPYFRALRNGLPGFVDALPDTSEVALILLSGRARMVVDFEDGLEKVRDRLEEFFVDASRAAGFFAGVKETVARFEGEARWPVLMLVTSDGASMVQMSFTEGKYQALVDQIVELRVVVHALALDSQDGDGFQRGIALSLTEITRGRFDSLNSPSLILGEKLTAMAEEIARRHAAVANQYLVTFEPAPGATPTTLITAAVRRAQVTINISPDGDLRSLGASNELLLANAAEGVDDGASREEYWNAAERAFAGGDVEDAAKLYEKAFEADPTWVKPLLQLGMVTLNTGDIETAVKYFEQVLEVDPDSAEGAQATALIQTLKK